MPWYKRDFGTANHDREEQRFEKLYQDLNGPRGMMMVSADGTVYIALSAVLATRNFPEFQPSEAPPSCATPLFGTDADLAAFSRPDQLNAENDG